ncbi:hypothetical protein LIER_24810 [Lithospermum erythrorhizon]|uniref:Uncharacterized protein n=1 Tax=Lithospermum erythrorhizon TaxID=34254 RepID=A0AAV3R6H7_LITER
MSRAVLRAFECLRLLKIPSSLSDEVYFAAFLSCWPCIFVLPLDFSGSIRPSVFNMASCMAIGKIVSLGISVLASIYTSFHLIMTVCYSNSNCCSRVHYLLGWIGAYLRTSMNGKSAPRLPSPSVASSSKPLKKHSIPEDDLVDRDPKHAKWGSTRRPDPVLVLSPDAPILLEIVPLEEDEAQAEVMDID